MPEIREPPAFLNRDSVGYDENDRRRECVGRYSFPVLLGDDLIEARGANVEVVASREFVFRVSKGVSDQF